MAYIVIEKHPSRRKVYECNTPEDADTIFQKLYTAACKDGETCKEIVDKNWDRYAGRLVRFASPEGDSHIILTYKERGENDD